MWKRFYAKPFEAFVGLFVIINGILTLAPGGTGSAVKDNLWNILGVSGAAVPVCQIFAGLAKILGIASNKSNIEASGLIMVTAMFFIRSVMLVIDGSITAADLNNEAIAIGIIISNAVRLTQILKGEKHIVVAKLSTYISKE